MGPAGDRFEQEADRLADEMMRPARTGAGAPPNVSTTIPRVQRMCAACEREDDEVRGKAVGSSLARSPDVAEGIAATRGGGAPLPAQARAFFEPRLGHDLGRVRIHTGGDAEGLATRLGARAFTVGRDIYFGAGEYRPPSEAGRRLLAHELVHVVQQEAAGPPARAVSQPGDPDERAADAAAAQVERLAPGQPPVRIAPATVGARVHRAVRE
ncbi:MAG TPA: DUF4157 domain-containing protein, partial [Kofleriaceae bacterium]|nr:DUF4157 domain-containing protein [Kofleriaceae bacterium]